MKKWYSVLILVIALALTLSTVAYAENDPIDPTAASTQRNQPR